MSELPSGKFIVNAGDFRGRMRNPTSTNQNPVLDVNYRILADPTNLDGLTRVQKQLKLGYIWEQKHQIGWTVGTIVDMNKLWSLLWPGASKTNRGEVVEAWGHALRLLPSNLRPILAVKDKEYRAADWLKDRTEAVEALRLASKRYPRDYFALPPNYFDLWT